MTSYFRIVPGLSEGRIVTSLVGMLSLAKFINLEVNVLQATPMLSFFEQSQS